MRNRQTEHPPSCGSFIFQTGELWKALLWLNKKSTKINQHNLNCNNYGDTHLEEGRRPNIMLIPPNSRNEATSFQVTERSNTKEWAHDSLKNRLNMLFSSLTKTPPSKVILLSVHKSQSFSPKLIKQKIWRSIAHWSIIYFYIVFGCQSHQRSQCPHLMYATAVISQFQH